MMKILLSEKMYIASFDVRSTFFVIEKCFSMRSGE